jgi:hypothetical protein
MNHSKGNTRELREKRPEGNLYASLKKMVLFDTWQDDKTEKNQEILARLEDLS